jgi:DNA (cytosine-5)-methyltransferase 1
LRAYENGLGWYAASKQDIVEGEFLDELQKLPSMISIEDALSDLPKAAEEVETGVYSSGPKTDYQRVMRLKSNRLMGHFRWNHCNKLIKKMSRIPEGGVCRSEKYFSQAYSRLHRNGFARTITGHFHNPGSGRFIHYKENRTLTIREAARLQGFEDNFEFLGSPTDQRRMIGNAFPKTLASAIARHVAHQLKNSS